MNEEKYFVTVDWCNKGKRGIFCDRKGNGFWKNSKHTEEEIHEILDTFALILNPKSEIFTEEQLKKYGKWIPLAEYNHEYGIAIEVKR